jgi:nucleoside-diphosphate-sugar epimerase
MRIFLTGGTGYVGGAILDALVRAGHEMAALVRNGEKAKEVSARGARPVIGNLAAPDSYRTSLAGHDGYVHAAVDNSPKGPDIDRAALDTLLQAARAGHVGFFIYTSGVWVLGECPQPVTEEAPVRPTPLAAWRPAHEQLVTAGHGNGLRTVIVRPGVVYGGSRGIVGDMFRDAANGLMRVIGGGDNRWPLVYDRDLGDLYAKLVARADAAGVFHATDEADERVNDLAQAIAGLLPRRPDIRHMPIEEARAKMGAYADALALDQVVRSPRARALGWTPSLRSVSRNAPRLYDEWRSGQS